MFSNTFYTFTPAPVEYLISVAGNIVRPNRCQLSDKMFETLCMLGIMHQSYDMNHHRCCIMKPSSPIVPRIVSLDR